MDDVPPIFNLPAQNDTVDCANLQDEIQLWLDTHGGAQATDACSSITWTYLIDMVVDDCGTTSTESFIFIATDECGNSNSSLATIFIEDHSAPIIEQVPVDTMILCGSDDQTTVIENWLNHQGGAIANDLCGTVTWTNDYSFGFDTCGPVGIHQVLFTAMDECGNATTIQAILTIQDSLHTTIANVEEFEFRVFPNPASETLHIVIDKKEFGSIQITLFDECGKALWSEKNSNHEFSIPIHSYPPGAYFLKVRTVRDIYSRKVIIK